MFRTISQFLKTVIGKILVVAAFLILLVVLVSLLQFDFAVVAMVFVVAGLLIFIYWPRGS